MRYFQDAPFTYWFTLVCGALILIAIGVILGRSTSTDDWYYTHDNSIVRSARMETSNDMLSAYGQLIVAHDPETITEAASSIEIAATNCAQAGVMICLTLEQQSVELQQWAATLTSTPAPGSDEMYQLSFWRREIGGNVNIVAVQSVR